MKLELTQGYFTEIDAEDYPFLSKFNWTVLVTKHNNYAKTIIEGKTILLHRLLLKADDTKEVDHINHNGLDNRKENLRLCTSIENKHNTRVRKDNKLKLKGVYFNQKEQKYYAMIKPPEETRLFLGGYDTPEEAARAYNVAAESYFGAFAQLNTIGDLNGS